MRESKDKTEIREALREITKLSTARRALFDEKVYKGGSSHEYEIYP